MAKWSLIKGSRVVSQVRIRHVFLLGLLSSFSLAYTQTEVGPPSTLPALIQEATERNPEILEAQKAYEQAQARQNQARSPFYPEFGVEGGLESYKTSSESLSNSFGYVFGRYNLYRGGRDRYGLLARTKEEAFASFELLKTKTRIQREISSQYYSLLYLQEAIQVKEEALKLNASQVQMAEKRARSGITSQVDVLEFELRDATLKSDIYLLTQERDQAMREIKRLLNRSDDSKVTVQGELGHEHLNRNVPELLELALKERPDLRANDKDQEVASLAYSATLGEWLPKVDAEVTYGTLDRRNRVLDQTPSWDALIKISIPLFSGFDSYYGRKAQAKEVARLDARGTKIRQDVRTQVESAFARVKAIESRVDLEEKNIERAKQYYSITLSEYKRGVKNSPDLAGAAERLFDSRLRILEFRKEFYLARIGLAEAVGIEGFSP